MGQLIGELILIIGGVVCFLVFGGYYMPNFKTEKEKEKHLTLIKNKGNIFKFLGLVLAISGVYRLISNLI